jgi:hypothetical protein
MKLGNWKDFDSCMTAEVNEYPDDYPMGKKSNFYPNESAIHYLNQLAAAILKPQSAHMYGRLDIRNKCLLVEPR